jgi:hypothetical protein
MTVRAVLPVVNNSDQVESGRYQPLIAASFICLPTLTVSRKGGKPSRLMRGSF